MPGIALWELLSYVVTVIGLPLAIYTFWHEQHANALNSEKGVSKRGSRERHE